MCVDFFNFVSFQLLCVEKDREFKERGMKGKMEVKEGMVWYVRTENLC